MGRDVGRGHGQRDKGTWRERESEREGERERGRERARQLGIVAPLMLALTAATPIWKGMLADTDVRWSVIRWKTIMI